MACLLSPLCDLQLPIGKMLELSKEMRTAGDARPPYHPLINSLAVGMSALASLKRLSEASGILGYHEESGGFAVPT